MTEQNDAKDTKATSGSRKLGMIFALIIIIALFCVFGYGYFKLANVNVSLAKTLTKVQQGLKQNQEQVTEQQKKLNDLDEALKQIHASSLQQEQLLNEMRAVRESVSLSKLACTNGRCHVGSIAS